MSDVGFAHLAPEEIVNRALQEIGTRTTVQSLQENSNEAIEAGKIFAPMRNQVLGAAWWNFARVTDRLDVVKWADGRQWDRDLHPAPPWLYQYDLPCDCIRARFLNPHHGPGGNRFQVAGRSVLTNVPAAILTYTQLVEELALWDDTSLQVLVLALAASLVFQLSGSLELREKLIAKANGFIINARALDGNEGVEVLDHVPDWIQARSIGPYPHHGMTPYYYPYGPLF